MHKVIMLSGEYGMEEFKCESAKEAAAKFLRLKKSCRKHAKKDGVERRLMQVLVLKDETVKAKKRKTP